MGPPSTPHAPQLALEEPDAPHAARADARRVWSRPIKRQPKPGAVHTLGDRIHAARKALKLSQTELGDRAGVSRRTVMRWELDRGRPSGPDLGRVVAIIHALHPGHADAIASAAGQSLAAFGLAGGGVPRAVPSDHVGDGLVAVAAEVLDVSPRLVRPALIAALRRARALGLSIDDAERCLVRAAE